MIDRDIIPLMFFLIALIALVGLLLPVAGYAAVNDIFPGDSVRRGMCMAGGQVNHGGETRINGVDQHNAANNKRLMAGMSWFLPQKHQLILRFSRDVAIDNGFRNTREVTLRLQKVF